jgi:hypothetical protein
MTTPTQKHHILIFGASYGSLLGIKMALAGHHVTLVCLPDEAKLINEHGAIVRTPVKGYAGLVELNSKKTPGSLDAKTPSEVNIQDYDLVGLAMQEPQYGSSGVRELLHAVALSGKPCMSIMNMPPLPYLQRIKSLKISECLNAFTDPSVWQDFDPELMTLCSPDPQAFRPVDQPLNVLQVRLPTNFKVSEFKNPKYNKILTDLESSIEAIPYSIDGINYPLPVKLKVHPSLFVPLAKWAMLITGNYRCILDTEMQSIKNAVHSNLAESQSIYQWVVDLCVSLGAEPSDMVPFEKYAQAALGLESPSSAARALFAGAKNIERVDRLVQSVASSQGKNLDTLDQIVRRVDQRLKLNRSAS